LSATPSTALSLGLAVLVVWRVYTRIRRLIGRQQLSRLRPWITVTLFPLLLLMLGVFSLAHPPNALSLLAGAAVGIGLGVYGLRLTKFEATPAGLFYTPNAHLGIALSLLFIGRIAYRFAQLYLIGSDGASSTPDAFLRSPWTLLIFGTLAGYYVCYAVGLLRWRRSLKQA
jgi:hypothetical protein